MVEREVAVMRQSERRNCSERFREARLDRMESLHACDEAEDLPTSYIFFEF
jgi:hypothetical protein